MCDSLWVVQGKEIQDPQQTGNPRVYSQQAAPGYIPFCWNKSLPSRALANSKYFFHTHRNKKFQQDCCHWDLHSVLSLLIWTFYLPFWLWNWENLSGKMYCDNTSSRNKGDPFERNLCEKAVGAWRQAHRGLIFSAGLYRRTLLFHCWSSQVYFVSA